MYSSTASRVSRRAPANWGTPSIANGCEFLSAVLNGAQVGARSAPHSGCARERRPLHQLMEAFARDFYLQSAALTPCTVARSVADFALAVLTAVGMARFGRSRRQSASSMFADYNTNAAPSFTEQARARRDAEERNTDPFCCCCKSSHVLITCNTATFIFSIGLILMGAFVNNEVKGWKLAMFDMLGNLCLAVGAFIAVVSILGIMAGRTKARIFMFVYFMLVLMVAVLLVLITVFIATENDKIDFFLRENWEEVQKVVGVDVDVDDAASLLHDYFYVIAAVASTGCGINIASIGAAAR